MSQPDRHAIGIEVGFAASGTAYAAWQEQASAPGTPFAESVRAATHAPFPAGGWSAPVEVSRPGLIGDVQLAVSPSGRALAAWRFGGQDSTVEAAYRADGWSAWGDPTGGTAKDGFLDIAVDDVGHAVAVWTDPLARTLSASYRSMFSTAWTSPVELDPAQSVFGATAVFDGAGNATAVWSAYDAAAGVWVVRSARRPAATGTWTGPVRVAALRGHPARASVRSDGRGNVLAVWDRVDGDRQVIEYAGRAVDSEQWSAPVEISAPLRMVSPPRLAVSPAGDAVAVWWARPDGNTPVVQAAARLAGSSSWSGPVDVSTPGGTELHPDVAIDHRGNAVAVWQRYDGTRSVIQASLRPAAYGRWLAPSDLGQGTSPTIALDRSGNGVAAWNGSATVHAAALTAVGPIVTGFSVPRSGHTGRPIALAGSATPWAHPLTESPQWELGDGRVVVGANVTVAYPRPGKYTVNLTQIDSGRGATTVTGTIEITAPPEPLRVTVGRGIGAVRLGQSRAAVVRAYGAPMTEGFARYPNRRPGRVSRYPRPNGTLIVGFHGGRVVLVATTSRSDRTARGVGPGSPRRAAARLAGFRPSPSGYTRRAGGTTTTFTAPGRTIPRVSIARAGFARA
jgi:hypothetical protein